MTKKPTTLTFDLTFELGLQVQLFCLDRKHTMAMLVYDVEFEKACQALHLCLLVSPLDICPT